MRRRDHEIAPDEIFLDASNLPAFDQSRLEGRLEKPISQTTYRVLIGGLFIMFLALASQAWNLEIRQGVAYAQKSERNSLRPQTIFAERGAILDRNGIPLATNVLAASSSDDQAFPSRVYKAPGFGNLLGYVSYPKKDSSGNYYDTDMDGVAGVEKDFNTELKGQNGSILVEEDSQGHTVSEGSTIPPVNGATLTLSIDSRVQKAFYDAIREQVDGEQHFTSGAGILMDIQTGEILALVSYPEYDPNVLSEGAPKAVIAGYATDPRTPYLNRPIQGLYTPGSIVKPLEAAGALTDGIITPDTTIVSNGFISVPNPYDPKNPSIFKDWKALGALDLRHAIGWSSDVYFYTVGGGYGSQKGLGIDRLDYWFRTFGLTSPTGINLSGENHGFLPTPEWKQKTYGDPWRIGDTYHTAIGQYAVQVTPIEMARAIAAVANGGKLLTPTIVKGGSTGGESLAIKPDTFEVIREGMRIGVLEGTSVLLNSLGFVDVAGKTGTAQTGAGNESFNAWEVGFFPYEHPRYVHVVVLEHGVIGNSTGGVHAIHDALEELHTTAPEYFQ